MEKFKYIIKIIPIFLLVLGNYAYASTISTITTFKATAIKDSSNNSPLENEASPLKLESSSKIENMNYMVFEKNIFVKKVLLPTETKIENYYWKDK